DLRTGSNTRKHGTEYKEVTLSAIVNGSGLPLYTVPSADEAKIGAVRTRAQLMKYLQGVSNSSLLKEFSILGEWTGLSEAEK
ncbi:hypothetical protein KIPB_014039, partial [Kipferlia bialata]